MLNIDIFPGADDKARNFPSDVTLALANDPKAPLGNGDPEIWVRLPFAAMLKTVIVCDNPFAAIRNLSSGVAVSDTRSEEHTSELQSLRHLVCRLLLEKKKTRK